MVPCPIIYLAAIFGFVKIGCAVSADFGLDALSGDDSSLFTADAGNAENLDLFLDSNLDPNQKQQSFDVSTESGSLSPDWDAPWLTSNIIFEPELLETSCAGDGSQPLGKTRHRREMCIQNTQEKEEPIVIPKLPNLLELDLERKLIGPDEFWINSLEDKHECPSPFVMHVCCVGPGLQSHPDSGIWDAVQACQPCLFHVHSRACRLN